MGALTEVAKALGKLVRSRGVRVNSEILVTESPAARVLMLSYTSTKRFGMWTLTP